MCVRVCINEHVYMNAYEYNECVRKRMYIYELKSIVCVLLGVCVFVRKGMYVSMCVCVCVCVCVLVCLRVCMFVSLRE